MILLSAEFNDVFRSFRRALDADVFNDPGVVIFLILTGLAVFGAGLYYLYRVVSSYREKQRLDLLVRELIMQRCGLSGLEKAWLNAVIVKRKIKPTYKPLIFKSQLKRLVSDKRLSRPGISPDHMVRKIFR